jgi:hypothetical protein
VFTFLFALFHFLEKSEKSKTLPHIKGLPRPCLLVLLTGLVVQVVAVLQLHLSIMDYTTYNNSMFSFILRTTLVKNRHMKQANTNSDVNVEHI